MSEVSRRTVLKAAGGLTAALGLGAGTILATSSAASAGVGDGFGLRSSTATKPTRE